MTAVLWLIIWKMSFLVITCFVAIFSLLLVIHKHFWNVYDSHDVRFNFTFLRMMHNMTLFSWVKGYRRDSRIPNVIVDTFTKNCTTQCIGIDTMLPHLWFDFQDSILDWNTSKVSDLIAYGYPLFLQLVQSHLVMMSQISRNTILNLVQTNNSKPSLKLYLEWVS